MGLRGLRRNRVHVHFLGRFVAAGADDRARADDGGGFRAEPEGQAGAAPERRGQRHAAQQRLHRAARGALLARQRLALRAFAQMGAQLPALAAGELAVDLLREEELGLGAGEVALELLAQRTPRAEEDGLDGGDGRAHDLGDLGVAPSFELAHRPAPRAG